MSIPSKTSASSTTERALSAAGRVLHAGILVGNRIGGRLRVFGVGEAWGSICNDERVMTATLQYLDSRHRMQIVVLNKGSSSTIHFHSEPCETVDQAVRSGALWLSTL